MADKSGSSRGIYILSFFTILNFAAFIGIVVYHVQYERTLSNEKLHSGTEIFQDIVSELKAAFKPAAKRSVDSLFPELTEFLQIQKASLLQECRDEVLQTLVSANPLTDTVGHSLNKRQTGSTGNDLASIFGEIAKTEVSILAKYCNNGSFVCLPGQKGDTGTVGLKGDTGPAGPKGDRGLSPPPGKKGDAGIPGIKGERGDTGSAGLPGVKGEKGESGADGQSITGPPGPKGEKGDSADVIPMASQCCSRLTAPFFGEQVETIEVLEGSNLTLNCNPSGYPVPQLTWSPEPATLPPMRARVTPTSVTINNAQVTDGKMYTCLARNALGSSEKQFVVSVYKHIKFDEVPQNYTVMMLKPVTLECMIEGPLSPHIAWYKIMPDGSRYLLTNNITPIVNGSQLHIDHVTSADVGQYVCEGSNGMETITKTAFVHTYGPPHIIDPGTVHANSGTNVVLKCDTDSYPASNITWKYPPGVTNAYKETDGTLMVVGAKPKDSTYFICIATNQYGTDQATLQLKVDVPPSVTVIPGTAKLTPGGNIALECRVAGDPPLTVAWSKDGAPISSDGHYLILSGNVLLINAATRTDVGNYTCTASNSLGSAQGTTIVS